MCYPMTRVKDPPIHMSCTHKEWFETSAPGALLVDRRCRACNETLPPSLASGGELGIGKVSPKGRPSKVTNELIERICSMIMTGTYAHVAAKACGIDGNTWKLWTKREDDPYAEMMRRVNQAEAECRAGAEAHVRMADPLKWLLHGPGRDKGPQHDDGWTRQTRTEISGPGGTPIESKFDLSGLSLEQLDAIDLALKRAAKPSNH